MNDYVDLHTHTIASGHAYSTIEAMIKAAEQKGIRLFGITEHAPKMPGTCSELYFNNLRVLERKHGEMYTLFGAELNIMDMEGHVDLPERTLKQMDLCVASMHGPCFHPGTIEENTKTYLNVMKNPYVNIIGHPDDGIYPLEYEPIVEAAKETNTLLEVNNNSLNPAGSRKHTRENLIAMLELCKEYKQPVIMNSDSHVFCDVARRDFSEKLIKEIDFPEELIVNRSVDVFKEYIHRKYEEK